MVNFEPVPSEEHFRMETMIPLSVANTLKAIRDLEGSSVTEGVRKAVGIYKWCKDCLLRGELLIASQPDRLEALELPARIASDESERYVRLIINVNPAIKECLETFIGQADFGVESEFWRTIMTFYSDLIEKQFLGSKFYSITPGWVIHTILLDDPFAPGDSVSSPSSARRWLNFARRFMRRGKFKK